MVPFRVTPPSWPATSNLPEEKLPKQKIQGKYIGSESGIFFGKCQKIHQHFLIDHKQVGKLLKSLDWLENVADKKYCAVSQLNEKTMSHFSKYALETLWLSSR